MKLFMKKRPCVQRPALIGAMALLALGMGISPSLSQAQEAAPAKPILAIKETTAAPPINMKFDDSRVRIIADDPESEAVSKQVRLERGKAAIVELPRDARDILVSDPKVADARIRTPRQIYVIGMAIGATNLIFFDERGDQILNLELLVQLDAKGATAALERHFPDSNLQVEALNNNLAISGRVPNAAASDKAQAIVRRFVDTDESVVNLLAVEGDDQVLLKVRVAEVQRTIIKQMGIDLFGRFDVGGAKDVLELQTSNQFNIAGNAIGGLTGTGSRMLNAASGQVLSGVIRALERDGLVRVLAEPNLTAVSGESAKFLAGGEFPVPAGRDRDGNITIEFKPFGVGLGFTPVVLSDGRINLRLSTEVSQISNARAVTLTSGFAVITDPDTGEQNIQSSPGTVIPGLSVRRAETSVELPSGGSLVIAGLLQNDIQKSIDGIPGLKDIPILGTLFRSSDFLNNETELVIIVTPYLVSAVSEDELRLPTDGFAPASDFDTYFLGRLTGAYKRAPSPDTALQGPYGFIME